MNPKDACCTKEGKVPEPEVPIGYSDDFPSETVGLSIKDANILRL